MISIDKAKQLKKLNLIWIPKQGDFYLYENSYTKETCIDLVMQDNPGFWCDATRTWLPSLKQLLNEIKKYNWTLTLYSENEIEIETRIEHVSIIDRHRNFEGEIIEDIVADALIWILECKQV